MRYGKFRRKIRFPTTLVFLTVASWAALAGLVVLVDPVIFAGYQYLPIWPAMFLALAATMRLILGSWRRGLIFALAGTAYMVFRYLGIGYWIYGVLLLGLAGVADWYLRLRNTRKTQ